uniref:Nuclear receptor n=1 Tax=Caenorhabditis tropicalis TaxID=1561998 RepID=A0A1I7TP31_9PELO
MSNEPSTSDSRLPDIIITEDDRFSDNTRRSIEPKRNILPEKCLICGNPAVGYHYDVASCNGCKAFFRRTVITGRVVKCRNGNQCLEENDPIGVNRRLCGGCRFAKCEEMGMNPMAIRAEIISSKGKELKEKLVRKRESEDFSVVRTINVEDELTEVITKLTLIESKLDGLSNSTLPRHYVDLRPLSDIVFDNTTTDVSKIPSLSFFQNQTFPDHAGLAHTSFLAVVEFAKLLDFSRKIDSDSLLKVMRHGTLMSRWYNCWKPMRNYNGVWVEQRLIVQKTLHAFLRNNVDNTEYLLLKAIVLSNPAVMGISKESQVILEEERQRYARSLLNYCLRQNGSRFGPDRFVSLISIMSVMENQQKEEKSFNVILRAFYSNVTVLVSPLYDEIMAS